MAPQTKAASAVEEVTTASFRADVLTASSRQPGWSIPGRRGAGRARTRAGARESSRRRGRQVALVRRTSTTIPRSLVSSHPVDSRRHRLRQRPAGRWICWRAVGSQIRGSSSGLVGPLEGGSAALVAEADELAAKGGADGAAALYSEILAEDPVDPKAIGGLAKLHVAAGRLNEAKALLETAPLAPAGKDQDPAVAAASAALRLAEQASSVGELAPLEQAVAANPDDHQARFDLAVALSAKGDRAAAADQLLELIRRDRSWNDQAARKQLLQLFEAWGLMDPESVAARRKLSAIWF